MNHEMDINMLKICRIFHQPHYHPIRQVHRRN